MAKGPSVVYDPDYVYLIGRVKEARLEAGLTQVAVAKELNKPLSFISKVEQGERRLDPIELQRLAAIYDKPFEYFLPRSSTRAKKTRTDE